MNDKRLTRSIHDRKLGGVCGGIAEYFDIDPSLVRLGYAMLCIFTALFPCILLYIIACLVVPNAQS